MKKTTVKLLVGTAALACAFMTYSFTVDRTTATATVQSPEDQMKLSIQDKMWNSIDNFQTVEGTFVTKSQRLGNTSVEFHLREGNNPSSYVKVNTAQGTILESVADGKHVMNKENGKVFMNVPYVAHNDKPATRYNMHPDGTKEYVHRSDPSRMFAAADAVFPENVALGYLEDHAKWSVQNNQTFLGRTVYLIQGTLSDSIQQKHKTQTFQLWVDQQTGILLKMDEYNQIGEPTEELKMTSLKVNGAINNSLFTIPQDVVNQTIIHSASEGSHK